MNTKTNRFCASSAAAASRAGGWSTTPTAGGSARCAAGGWRTGRGRVVAVRGPDAAARGDVFRDPEGRPLATLRPGKDGVTLAFTEAVAADPFAKMLMLAAALHG